MDASPKTGPGKPAFSIDEFCQRWGIGRTKVYEEIRSGRLRLMKMGRLSRITTEAEADWQRLYEEQSAEAADEWRRRIKERFGHSREPEQVPSPEAA